MRLPFSGENHAGPVSFVATVVHKIGMAGVECRDNLQKFPRFTMRVRAVKSSAISVVSLKDDGRTVIRRPTITAVAMLSAERATNTMFALVGTQALSIVLREGEELHNVKCLQVTFVLKLEFLPCLFNILSTIRRTVGRIKAKHSV
jgi:hypothetical protein